MINKSLLIEKPLNPRIIDQGIPDLSDNDVLIKVKTAGICGTDVHIYEGSYLGDYPVLPGHEFSGVVEDIGSKVGRIKKKDRVAVEPNIACNNCRYCLQNEQNFCEHWQAVGVTLPGGMARFVKAPENAVFPLGDLSFDQGAFMEPLSCVLHGIEKLAISFGQTALVIGAGPVGLIIFQVLKTKGFSEISVVENNHLRADFAGKYGVCAVYNTIDEIKNKSFDIVIDATGVVPVMKRTLDFARPGGQVLMFGVPPIGEILELDAFQIFRKGLRISSSFTSVRNSLQALSLLSAGLINVEDLITHRLPLEEFERGISLMKDKNECTMKVMICPDD